MVVSDQQIKWSWFKFDQISARQLDQVYRLRQSVFVVEQNCPYLDADGKDQYAIHLVGMLNHQLVATLRLFPKYPDYNDQVSFGRVCTSIKVRKKGIGQKLITEAMRYADKHYPEQSIQIGAQSYLENFYMNFGFVKNSDEYLEDNIPHILMRREINN